MQDLDDLSLLPYGKYSQVIMVTTPQGLTNLPLCSVAACVVHREEWYTSQVSLLGKVLKGFESRLRPSGEKEGRGPH